MKIFGSLYKKRNALWFLLAGQRLRQVSSALGIILSRQPPPRVRLRCQDPSDSQKTAGSKLIAIFGALRLLSCGWELGLLVCLQGDSLAVPREHNVDEEETTVVSGCSEFNGGLQTGDASQLIVSPSLLSSLYICKMATNS